MKIIFLSLDWEMAVRVKPIAELLRNITKYSSHMIINDHLNLTDNTLRDQEQCARNIFHLNGLSENDVIITFGEDAKKLMTSFYLNINYIHCDAPFNNRGGYVRNYIHDSYQTIINSLDNILKNVQATK